MNPQTCPVCKKKQPTEWLSHVSSHSPDALALALWQLAGGAIRGRNTCPVCRVEVRDDPAYIGHLTSSHDTHQLARAYWDLDWIVEMAKAGPRPQPAPPATAPDKMNLLIQEHAAISQLVGNTAATQTERLDTLIARLDAFSGSVLDRLDGLAQLVNLRNRDALDALDKIDDRVEAIQSDRLQQAFDVQGYTSRLAVSVGEIHDKLDGLSSQQDNQGAELDSHGAALDGLDKAASLLLDKAASIYSRQDTWIGRVEALHRAVDQRTATILHAINFHGVNVAEQPARLVQCPFCGLHLDAGEFYDHVKDDRCDVHVATIPTALTDDRADGFFVPVDSPAARLLLAVTGFIGATVHPAPVEAELEPPAERDDPAPLGDAVYHDLNNPF